MKVLNAGCGQHPLPPWFEGEWEEIRYDIEPANKPDIIGSITELGDIGPFDAVSCSHTLEHLYPHEVPKALSEFRRVLKPGGALVVMVPDLEDIRPTDEVLYDTADGPVTGLDIIYGLHWSIEQSIYMAHHTGFTATLMRQALEDAGFWKIETKRLPIFNLLGVAIK